MIITGDSRNLSEYHCALTLHENPVTSSNGSLVGVSAAAAADAAMVEGSGKKWSGGFRGLRSWAELVAGIYGAIHWNGCFMTVSGFVWIFDFQMYARGAWRVSYILDYFI